MKKNINKNDTCKLVIDLVLIIGFIMGLALPFLAINEMQFVNNIS